MTSWPQATCLGHAQPQGMCANGYIGVKEVQLS